MPGPLDRLRPRALRAALVPLLLLAACDASDDPAAPPGPATLSGEVRIVGSAGGPPTSGTARLFRSVEDLDAGRAAWTAPVEGAGGTWRYRFAALPADRYYLVVCLRWPEGFRACRPYADAAGEARPLDVRGGDDRVADLDF